METVAETRWIALPLATGLRPHRLDLTAEPPEEMNPHMTKRIIDLGLCVALLLASCVPSVLGSERRQTPLVRAVQMTKSSVVNIHSEKTAASSESVFSNGRPRKVSGMGTGIVVDDRGYIVTNHHVVQGVDSLRVSLENGSMYTAEVISYDREHDLAIIKINCEQQLTVMPIGTSSDIMLGETVFAVGNAFGYEHSITSGIVSALSRNVEVNETQSYRNLIQTDASINPGNSGGPLLNLDGEVIGINVAIRAGAQRIGFAIPIDDARRIIARLLNIEELSNTTHGTIVRDIKSANECKLVIDDLVPNGPAQRAGLQSGDVIVRAGGKQVEDAVDFERSMLGRTAGDKIDVVVLRDGEQVSLELALSSVASESRNMLVSKSVERGDSLTARTWKELGMELAPITTAERQVVQPRYNGGLRVVKVNPRSPAAQNGVQAGDILVGLHIWETLNTDNIRYVLDHPQLSSFNPVKFYIVRRGKTLYGHMQVAVNR